MLLGSEDALLDAWDSLARRDPGDVGVSWAFFVAY